MMGRRCMQTGPCEMLPSPGVLKLSVSKFTMRESCGALALRLEHLRVGNGPRRVPLQSRQQARKRNIGDC